MVLKWEKLNGRSGHDAAWQLLTALYRQETGGVMPDTQKTAQGKPFFPDHNYHFSIAHTREHAFCCLSRNNVGIDAEDMDRQIDLRLAERILSPAEKARFDAAPDPRAALLRLWVLKEATAKLTGRGWGSYLYETDLDPEDPRIQIIDGCYVAVLTEERNITHAV